jgi:hypothetical protein
MRLYPGAKHIPPVVAADWSPIRPEMSACSMPQQGKVQARAGKNRQYPEISAAHC